MKGEDENLERRRGYNDAVAGHGPALFDGSYMTGYRRGRAKIGQPMVAQNVLDSVNQSDKALSLVRKLRGDLDTLRELVREGETWEAGQHIDAALAEIQKVLG